MSNKRTKAHNTYFVDGGQVPGVTDIIGSNLGWNKAALIAWANKMSSAGQDPDKIRDQAAGIGTITHAMVKEFLLEKTFDRDEYPPLDVQVAERAFLGFMRWFEDSNIKVLDSELPLTHSEWYYGGTLDLKCELDGDLYIVDFKTSTGVYLEHKIQLAAYRELVIFNNVNEQPLCGILHLSKRTGKHKFYNNEALGDLKKEWETFLSCRHLHDLRKQLENGN